MVRHLFNNVQGRLQSTCRGLVNDIETNGHVISRYLRDLSISVFILLHIGRLFKFKREILFIN